MKQRYLAATYAAVLTTANINTSSFAITALSSREGYSLLECWKLSSMPVEAMDAINFNIGSTTKATWSVIEPHTTVGEAWAPSVQLSIILNGLIRITAPSPISSNSSLATTPPLCPTNYTNSSQQTSVAYIMPGTIRSSVLIAADMKTTSYITGHYTEFPSNEPTVLIQIPFVDNLVPHHVVLHEGPCK
ncbi:hypothetical protein CONLIGDRAFT_650842 [Coniochaeta ligniaria NRRL 30616]|uniref:Uncharacterized protein n=1 Tax=Coniochaeta ligniaria NRRL 30616 TaxID=1408157 RepID=A0A1J7JXY2_9PEZI|nr:hypothetical protein CONLIGDRAFT_650842 [Coniochaeta ligniaria NRRL 30616]